MPLSRRALLAAQRAAAGAALLPGGLLAALDAATPPAPKLDDWVQVRNQFRLAPEYLDFAGFFIASHPSVRVHTTGAPALSAGICCFEVDGKKPEEVVKALLAKKVIASTSPYANTYARLSAGIFNTEAEVDQALGALRTSIA